MAETSIFMMDRDSVGMPLGAGIRETAAAVSAIKCVSRVILSKVSHRARYPPGAAATPRSVAALWNVSVPESSIVGVTIGVLRTYGRSSIAFAACAVASSSSRVCCAVAGTVIAPRPMVNNTPIAAPVHRHRRIETPILTPQPPFLGTSSRGSCAPTPARTRSGASPLRARC